VKGGRKAGRDEGVAGQSLEGENNGLGKLKGPKADHGMEGGFWGVAAEKSFSSSGGKKGGNVLGLRGRRDSKNGG